MLFQPIADRGHQFHRGDSFSITLELQRPPLSNKTEIKRKMAGWEVGKGGLQWQETFTWQWDSCLRVESLIDAL